MADPAVGGTYYFGNTLQHTSVTYGLFGVVLGLLVWLYLSAFAVVLGAELNSVRARRLWPRSLLTPFTDDVQLTRGDRKAYASYAQTERHKGFETVDVDFDQPAPDEKRTGREPRRTGRGEGDARTVLPPRRAAGVAGPHRRASRSSSRGPPFPSAAPTSGEPCRPRRASLPAQACPVGAITACVRRPAVSPLPART